MAGFNTYANPKVETKRFKIMQMYLRPDLRPNGSFKVVALSLGR